MDPVFSDAIAGRSWILDPDPWAHLPPGWTTIFRDALDRVGALMARHPGVQLRGLGVTEKFGAMRVRTHTRPPTDIEAEVVALWREAEGRSESTCQLCGRAGRLRTDRGTWFATTCDDHA